MKIRVTTDKYKHLGLYPGVIAEAALEGKFNDTKKIYERSLVFINYGKVWKLPFGECELVENQIFSVEDYRSVGIELDPIKIATIQEACADLNKEEYTGKSVDYYKVKVDNPTTESNTPYLAECNDLIEALGMNYAEGNAFKAIWRKCAARKFGVKKKGYDNGLYDSEKVVFFGERMVEQSKEQK